MTQIVAPNSPRVSVAITGARLTSDVKTVTTSSLERLLGIRIDPTGRSYNSVAESRLSRSAVPTGGTWYSGSCRMASFLKLTNTLDSS